MINGFIKTIVEQISLNDPRYTRLVCVVSNMNESIALLNVVRNNDYLTESNIKINNDASDIEMIQDVVTQIENKINYNALINYRGTLFYKIPRSPEILNFTQVLNKE